MPHSAYTSLDQLPLAGRGGIDAEAERGPLIDPDAALMAQVAAGSDAAFTTLVSNHQQNLVNFFTRMGAFNDCDDLVQETFLRLYRYRHTYRPQAPFRSFLYHLARNAWADRGRKILRFDRLVESVKSCVEFLLPDYAAPSGSAMDINTALDLLSPKLREAIVLNIYQGLRYQEVADVLGVPLGTVKSRINLAITELKKILHED